MKPVILESPYAPAIKKPEGLCTCNSFKDFCQYCELDGLWSSMLQRNLRYARRAVKDCLMRGESPFASHLLYTQIGILDDTNPEDRKLGIEAGFVWRSFAGLTVVYTDLGISKGMELGIKDAEYRNCNIEYRTIPNWEK